MKTQFHHRSSKTANHQNRVLRSLILVSVATVLNFSQGLMAQIPEVVFTESGNTLTETFNGTAVGHWTYLGASASGVQSWRDDFAPTFEIGLNISWPEPENPQLYNIIEGATVFSEALTPVGLVLQAGAHQLTGYVSPTGAVAADVSFLDNGDVSSSVPDTASTLTCMAMALAGLESARRRLDG
jgi:hypothetical protein